MKPFGAWFGRLALAGGCLAWAGCGGGSVPDPDSDSNAASEATARPVDRGAAPAPVAEAPAPEAAPAEPVAAARPEAPAIASNPPAEAEKPAPTLKGDASGTEEMLRIAATPAQTPPASETPGAGGSEPGGPGGLAMSGGEPGGPRGRGSDQGESPGGISNPPGLPQPMPGGPGAPSYPGGPGGPDGVGGSEAFRPPGVAVAPGEPGGPGMPGDPSRPGGPGEFTGIGGPGGMNGTNDSAPIGPNTFKHPATAVQAFLSALEKKDKDRLTQATARRAPTEADEKHRKIFAEIVDGSLSDEELDQMSKALKGFRVASLLQAKSTGRIGVLVTKMDGRSRLQRTITTRKEADGWKVLDVSSMLEFKAGMAPIFPGGFRGRRR